jgi:curved DNA-binding protein CbpA
MRRATPSAAPTSSSYLTARRCAATLSEATAAVSVLKLDSVMVSGKDLKKAYLAQVREHHPDKGGSEAKMKEITTSYELLKSLSATERRSFVSQAGNARGMPRDPHARPGKPRRGEQQNANAYDFQNAYRQRYEERHKPYYAHDPAREQYHDPHDNSAPYGSKAQFRREFHQVTNLPYKVMVVRAVAVYAAGCFIFFVGYRRYRDYIHDDGWALSREHYMADQAQQQDRMRAELRERYGDQERRHQQRNLERRQAKEKFKKTLSAAEERELKAEQVPMSRLAAADRASWPILRDDGSQGAIFRVPSDPVGITYYELPEAAAPPTGGRLPPVDPQHARVAAANGAARPGKWNNAAALEQSREDPAEQETSMRRRIRAAAGATGAPMSIDEVTFDPTAPPSMRHRRQPAQPERHQSTMHDGLVSRGQRRQGADGGTAVNVNVTASGGAQYQPPANNKGMVPVVPSDSRSRAAEGVVGVRHYAPE